MRVFYALALIAFAFCYTTAEEQEEHQREQVFVIGNARFTVLSPTLVRLEYNPRRRFVNRPTMLVANRQLAPVEFEAREVDGVFEIVTERLRLRYTGNGRLNAKNLEIVVSNAPEDIVWTPGMNAGRNLGGLGNNGDEGILTRDGWYVLDDSNTPLIGPGGRPQPRNEPMAQDLYFFGYGTDYPQALSDFNYLSGYMPLPPRWSFGLWFASNWPHTDIQILRAVRMFDDNNVPLDALILSLWHRFGWTGYEWNERRFPNPPGLLHRLRERGIRTGLKVYPGGAFQPLHQRYGEIAERVSVMLERAGLIFFDFGQQSEVDAYFDVLIRPLEEEGVDFWWAADGAANMIRHLPRQLWTSRLFFTRTRENRRSLIRAPYGGLGSNRFPITSLNEIEPNWETLHRLPQRIATAGNEGIAFVAHGIHQDRLHDELLIRWIQFSTFAPVMQIDSGEITDRMWEMDKERTDIVRRYLRLRKTLIPYLYSVAYEAHVTGMPMCRPLYIHFPQKEMAYNTPAQYMLGDCLMAAPVTEASRAGGVTTKLIWFPPGIWTDIFTNRIIEGPVELYYTVPLNLTPVFARAGSIIPRLPPDREEGLLLLDVFPGQEGEFVLYEDDGDTRDYLAGAYSRSTISYIESERVRLIRIGRYDGLYENMPAERSYLLRVHVVLPVESVSIDYQLLPQVEDARKEAGWHYLPDEGIVLVRTPPLPTAESADVVLLSLFDPSDRELAYRLRELVPRLESALAVLGQAARPDEPLPSPLAELAGLVREVMRNAETRAISISAPPVSREDIEQELFITRDEIKKLVAQANILIEEPRLKLDFMQIVAGIRMTSQIMPTPYRQIIIRTEIEHMVHGWGQLAGEITTEDLPARTITMLHPGDAAYEEVQMPVGIIMLDDIPYYVTAELLWNGLPVQLVIENVLANTYITQFYLIGPFGDTGYRRVMELTYPPEEAIELGESYIGKRRTPAEWMIHMWRAPVVYEESDQRIINFTALLRRMPPSVGYAYTMVYVPDDIDARLIISTEDDLALFVNQTLVFRHAFVRREQPERAVNIRLNGGWNELLVKTNDGGRLWGFSMRLLDRQNRPIPGAISGWGPGFGQ